MASLNRSWLTLIFIGIIFLLGYIGFSVYQSYFSADEDFNPTIVEFERSILISPKLQEHLDSFVQAPAESTEETIDTTPVVEDSVSE